MKRGICLILTVMLVLAMAGCGDNKQNGKSESATIRVAWWGNQSRHDITIRVLDMYKEQNANVNFEPEFMGYNGYYDKIATQAAAGNLPDIFQFGMEMIQAFSLVKKGQVAPLDKYIEDGTLDLSGVNDAVKELGKYNGKQYSVPLGVNAWAIIIDPAMFEKAGVAIPPDDYSWEQFYAMNKQIKDKLNVYGIYEMSTAWLMKTYYARSLNKDYYNQDGTGIGFSETEVAELLAKQLEFQELGVTPTLDVISQVKGPEDDPFVTGRAAMRFIPSNQYETFSALAKKPTRMITMPNAYAPHRPASLNAGMQFGVSEKSKNKEEAARVISYFTNDIAANKILNAERGVPISKAVNQALRENGESETKQVFEYIDKITLIAGKSNLSMPNKAAQIEKLLKDIEDKVLFKVVTPEQGAKDFIEEAGKLAAEN